MASVVNRFAQHQRALLQGPDVLAHATALFVGD
jgi:hypothetical protein